MSSIAASFTLHSGGLHRVASVPSFAPMRPNLLDWQWSLYGDNHTRRGILLAHLLTVPLFQLGTLALLASPLILLSGGVIAAASQVIGAVVTMAIVMAIQGRFHRAEPVPPVPFDGPIDVVSRIFAEQWITFPRFVLRGGLARAWRASAPS